VRAQLSCSDEKRARFRLANVGQVDAALQRRRRVAATVWAAWKTHLLLKGGDAQISVTSLLHRWAAIGGLRLWEATAEPVAEWAPFYSEVKLALLLFAMAADAPSVAAVGARVLHPAARMTGGFVRQRAIPRVSRVAVTGLSIGQDVLLELLAPALPADELRRWEGSLRRQAAAIQRSSATTPSSVAGPEEEEEEEGVVAAAVDRARRGAVPSAAATGACAAPGLSLPEAEQAAADEDAAPSTSGRGDGEQDRADARPPSRADDGRQSPSPAEPEGDDSPASSAGRGSSGLLRARSAGRCLLPLPEAASRGSGEAEGEEAEAEAEGAEAEAEEEHEEDEDEGGAWGGAAAAARGLGSAAVAAPSPGHADGRASPAPSLRSLSPSLGGGSLSPSMELDASPGAEAGAGQARGTGSRRDSLLPFPEA